MYFEAWWNFVSIFVYLTGLCLPVWGVTYLYFRKKDEQE